MAHLTGDEVLAALPDPTAVTPQEVSRFVEAAAARVAANHEDDVFPEEDPIAEALVWDYAHARALKLHLTKGEGATDTSAIDRDLERIEARFVLYDEENSVFDEPGGSVYVTVLPW